MAHDIAREVEKLADDFGIDKKRSIGEVAHELSVEPHVIRFWEEQFPQIKPEIGKGGRRYYYNKQLKVLKRIKKFLHDEGYTINGLQKLLKKRKQDSYKEEDLDIIAVAGNAQDLNDLELTASEINADDEAGFDIAQVIDEDSSFNVDLYKAKSVELPDSSLVPNTNLIANMGRTTNINKAPEYCLTKERRDEISSLLKNITKNLGDLKMLLRS